MSGKLWVIEGTDGSGKKTQTEILVNHLNSSGWLGANQAHYWPFPTYEDPVWGKLIKEHLADTSRRAVDYDPRYTALLYAGDRGKAAPKLKELMAAGDWIICDRYLPSNLAFQGAKIKDITERDEFIAWLEDKEYNYFEIPHPQGVIFLHLPIEVSMARTEERRRRALAQGAVLGDKVKAADIYEQDEEFVRAVNEEYVRLANLKNWHVIECMANDQQLPPEAIADKVWEIVTGQ